MLNGRRPERGVVTALDPAEWETHWSANLRPIDAALAESIATVEASGHSASIFHAGPDAMVQVFSLPGKRRDAALAARLALEEQSGRALEGSPHAVSCIGADLEHDPPLTHFLGCADSETGARVIAEWAARAGLAVARIAPIEAGTLTSVARQALETGSAGVEVRLRLGEDGSALEASEGGSLRLLRPVDVDLAVLVEALTRPISRHDDQGGSVSLTHAEARTMLFEVGVPERDTVIDRERGLKGMDILPLLSPVLQRCVVQVRQTLRFGLDEDARAHARLRVEGPGSRIPGLAQLISEETGLPLDARPETGAEFDAPGHPDGDLMTAVRSIPADVNLVPGSVAQSLGERRMKLAIAAGIAIAFGAVAADATMTELAFRATRDELRQVSAGATEARELLELRAELDQQRGAIGAVMNAAKKTVGEPVSWSALLREIAACARPEIRIVELSAGRDGAGAVLTLRGYLVSPDETMPAPEGVSAFLDDLAASPLCASVSMGETQRSRLDRFGALQFSATIRPRTLPMTAFVSAEDAR